MRQKWIKIMSLFNIFDTIGVKHLKVYFLVICMLSFVNIYLNHIVCQQLLQIKPQLNIQWNTSCS